MKKKILAVFLSLCMAMSLVPMSAMAAGETCAGGSNCSHVADIGGMHYDTLSAAIEAVQEGEEQTTIQLLKSTNEAVTIPVNKSIILDLAGYTLKNNASMQDTSVADVNRKHTITNYGKLTIIGNGTVDNVSHGKGALVNYGIAILNGGTFTRSAEASTSPTDNGGNSWYVIDNHGSMIINGASVINDSKLSSLVRNASEDEKDVSLTITDGYLKNDFIAVKNENEDLTITGGTVISEEQSLQNWGTATISGGALSGPVITWSFDEKTVTTISGQAVINGDVKAVEYDTDATPPTVKIEGGTITGTLQKGTYNNGVIPVEDNSTVAKFEISGGSFSKPVPAAYCAENFASLVQEDGTCTVVKSNTVSDYSQDADGIYYENDTAAATNNEASVTSGDVTTYYPTLAEAIEKAENGNTVTLLRGATLTSGITLTKPLKIVGTNNKPTITIDSDAKIRGFTLAAGSGGTEFANLTFNLDMSVADSAAIYFNDQFDNNDANTPVRITNVDFIGDANGDLATSNQQAIGILSASPEGGYVEVTGCTFENLKYAMYFNRMNHLTVTGNTIDGTRYGAIIVAADRGTRVCENIKISQNSLTNISVATSADPLYNSGIVLGAYTGSAVVENNSIQMADSSKKPVYIAQSEGDTSRVIVTYVNNGAEIRQQLLESGEQIHLLTLPDQGYNHFVGWTDQTGKHYDGGETVTITANTTFTAVWSYIPPANPNYQIAIGDFANGTITANPSAAKAGATVTLTATPDEGYALGTLTVTDRFGDAVRVTEQANGTYTFTMPDGQVTVSATFVETEEPAAEPFTDVDENDWFYDEVVYVYENGLMNGVGGNRFAPNTATNRAMLATILYRLAGEPDVSGDMPFTDVAAGTWYTDAVLWAAQNGIVNGLGENTFAPMNTLTREQLVTMLYRYAEAEGYDVSAAADLSGYPDAGKVQTYAQEAMSWAVAKGIVEGMDGNLNPAGNATRAQIATILMRFCENVAQ